MASTIEPAADARTPCGLYVHIPFCATKCGYCDFYSVPVKDRDPGPLIDRIGRELSARLAGNSHPVSTLFCGGGTPTVLHTEQLRRLINYLSEIVAVDRLVEFTVEANPATADDAKAALLVAGGVTRVSMGAQSFNPTELAVLERLHKPDDIGRSVGVLRHQGVRQVNLDLIFGIPGQTMESWLSSIGRAVDLGPDHIACYGLTYEAGTRLTAQRAAGRIVACDEDLEADMYLAAVDELAAAGFDQYEISNFARPGCECRHNLIYWRNGPYIGVGPSAAGCVDGRRYKNIADVAGYVRSMDERGHGEVESEIIRGETLILELILMQLRLVEGLSVEDFRVRTGFDPRALFAEPLARLMIQDLVAASDTHIALTRRGRLVANIVMAEFASEVRGDDVYDDRTFPRLTEELD